MRFRQDLGSWLYVWSLEAPSPPPGLSQGHQASGPPQCGFHVQMGAPAVCSQVRSTNQWVFVFSHDVCGRQRWFGVSGDVHMSILWVCMSMTAGGWPGKMVWCHPHWCDPALLLWVQWSFRRIIFMQDDEVEGFFSCFGSKMAARRVTLTVVASFDFVVVSASYPALILDGGWTVNDLHRKTHCSEPLIVDLPADLENKAKVTLSKYDACPNKAQTVHASHIQIGAVLVGTSRRIALYVVSTNC